MKQRPPQDKRIRKNVSLLKSVIGKAKELMAARNMGSNKFSQLLADLVLEAHDLRKSGDKQNSEKLVSELLAALAEKRQLIAENEDLRARQKQALMLANSYNCEAHDAHKRIKELENEARDRRLEDLRQAHKNPNQSQDSPKGGAPTT